MACYHPLRAFRSLSRLTEKGKCVIEFLRANVSDGPFEEIVLPCGKCDGCMIDRSRQWALRCVHEASLYENNCFITLTFRKECLNELGSLVKEDFQLFMKRLRKKFKGLQCLEKRDPLGMKTYPIRFFHCGEYGSKLQRPHHHACLFNFDFVDKELWSTRKGIKLYRSSSLEGLWPFGFSTIGAVTWESAAYIARYVTKKMYGVQADSHYSRLNSETGEMVPIVREYITMSRRPGIGKRWFDRFASDVFPKDFVTHGGRKFKPPSYYDSVYDELCPRAMASVKRKRLLAMRARADESSPSRLKAREACAKAKHVQLVREYEADDAEDVLHV